MAAKPIHSLTGVRALAAFLVFFSHFKIHAHTAGTFLQSVLAQGYIGVTLFYVLSGFLITHVYERDMDKSFRWYGHYLWRRFSRIYPVYLLALVVSIAVLFYYQPDMLSGQGVGSISLWLFAQLTLIKGLFSKLVFSGVPQAWSLTVEIMFYISAPLLFLALKNHWKYWLIPLSYLIGLELLQLGLHESWLGFFGNFHFVALYTYFGRFFEFFVGVLLALLIRRDTILDRLPGKTWIGLIGVFVLMITLYLLQGTAEFGFYTPVGMILNNWLLPLVIALFYLGLIREQTIIKQFFGSRLMQLLGRASYSFYLLQFAVMAFFVNEYPVKIHTAHSLGLVIAGFIVLNLIAIGVYRYIEDPAHRWLNKRCS